MGEGKIKAIKGMSASGGVGCPSEVKQAHKAARIQTRGRHLPAEIFQTSRRPSAF